MQNGGFYEGAILHDDSGFGINILSDPGWFLPKIRL